MLFSFLAMKTILICLLIFIPFTLCEDKMEVLQSISELTEELAVYKNPESYDKEFNQAPFVNEGQYGCYDFIIIGAGSAGTVLANRLSEEQKWKILLLEAGGDESLATDVPAMAELLQFSHFNWGYQTVPQKTCCQGMIDKKCNAPRGKVFGGSSTINYMMYTRGNREDYNKWAALGNPGWAYDDVLKYFKKSENSSLTTNVDQDYHGKSGTLHVEHVRRFGDLSQGYLDGEVELGSKIQDYNGRDQMVFSRLQSNTINGRRCSGNKAFLQPVITRKNLKVVKGAFVTKLLIENLWVYAVEFLVGNKRYYANVTKEVILSAGAIGSPQILLHSGIGPKKDLDAIGIKCCNELEVGKNLHDHPFLAFPFASNFVETGQKPLDQMVSEYLNGYGLLTAAADIQAIGFVNVDDPSASYPNLEQFFSPFLDLSDNTAQRLFNFNNETYNSYFKPYGTHVGLFVQYLAHPKSRGSVKLRSNNYFDHPLIDFNYFSDPQNDDIRVMRKGLKRFLKLAETNAMKDFNVTFLHNQIADCPQEFMSDEYIECLLRHVVITLYHQGGTCKMGPVTDPNSVVNHELKVRGMYNLRVIDASVIPFPLASHPNAPIYMIAEKGSDLIKLQYLSIY